MFCDKFKPKTANVYQCNTWSCSYAKLWPVQQDNLGVKSKSCLRDFDMWTG